MHKFVVTATIYNLALLTNDGLTFVKAALLLGYPDFHIERLLIDKSSTATRTRSRVVEDSILLGYDPVKDAEIGTE